MKVSALVVTYNHARFIAQALDSVLMQEAPFPWEILVSEDASTDGTREIVVEYQRRHPGRIRLLLSERNLRSNRVVARGFEAARGEYVALLDGDDYWTARDKLAKQAVFLDAHPECAMCFHNATVVHEDGSRPPWSWTPPQQKPLATLEDIWLGNFIATCSSMFRRGVCGPLPPWYDALDEEHRWSAQANFWSAIAKICSKSPAVFCYDLMNEPVVPGEKRPAGKWYSGKPLGGFDFVQFITLDPAGRKREDVAALWIKTLTAAIRQDDRDHPITVGLLPWVKGWGHLSGFIPETVAPDLDFLAVHLYPETGKVPEALDNLKRFALKDKPVIVEETFPLSCPPADLRQFLLASRTTAHGWLGHYEGATIADLESRQRTGELDLPTSLMLDWLRLFRDLGPEMTQPPAMPR